MRKWRHGKALGQRPRRTCSRGSTTIHSSTAPPRRSEGILLTSLDKAVNWARKNSIWPMSFGLACCAIEMMSMSASRFDIARFGAEVFRGSPRQSDLMIIAGRVSNKMAPVIRHLYQQMPEPKWAISMGACATSTGVFNNYALIPGEPGDSDGRFRARLPAASGAVDLRADAAAGEDPGPERHRETGSEPGVAATQRIVHAQTPHPGDFNETPRTCSA